MLCIMCRKPIDPDYRQPHGFCQRCWAEREKALTEESIARATERLKELREG